MKQLISALVECFREGHKLLICGNGGSAAMAQHMAAEFMNRFELDRPPLPAIALTTDTSFLTAYANDRFFNGVFARQVQALGNPGDILIGISTSGKSKNIIRALAMAKRMNLKAVDFPRKGKTTAHVQEYQIKRMHDIVREVERQMFQ